MWKSLILLSMLIILTFTQVKGANNKSKILTTTYELKILTKDLLKNQDHIEVESLLPAGFDEHEVQLTPHQISQIEGADLIVLNGLGLEEEWGESFQKILKSKPTVTVGDEVIKKTNQSLTSLKNPHYLMDPFFVAESFSVLKKRLLSKFKLSEVNLNKEEVLLKEKWIKLGLKLSQEKNLYLNPVISYHNSLDYLFLRLKIQVLTHIQERHEDALRGSKLKLVKELIQGRNAKKNAQAIILETKESFKIEDKLKEMSLKAVIKKIDTQLKENQTLEDRLEQILSGLKK